MKTSKIYNHNNLDLSKIIGILKIIRSVDDIELKDCALDSLLEMLEEEKEYN